MLSCAWSPLTHRLRSTTSASVLLQALNFVRLYIRARNYSGAPRFAALTLASVMRGMRRLRMTCRLVVGRIQNAVVLLILAVAKQTVYFRCGAVTAVSIVTWPGPIVTAASDYKINRHLATYRYRTAALFGIQTLAELRHKTQPEWLLTLHQRISK